MQSRLPIGYSEFSRIREEGLTYVDKSALIADVIRSPRLAVLLPRPRRFGKTLNLTMLRAFFDADGVDRRGLFEGLAVSRSGADVLEHQGRHPVIFLTFKDTKHRSWPEAFADLSDVVASEVLRLRETYGLRATTPEVQARFDALAARRAEPVDVQRALRLLSELLHQATGQSTVILVDEYDTPIHAGFVYDYYDEVVTFFRNFLSGGLKDNPWLYRGVLTGILRVARESIFSGLNNVAVHTTLSEAFSAHFGFTEDEVRALAEGADQAERFPELRRWYDGYRMGRLRIYNPWSVLCCLTNPADGMRPYWVNTASDEILRELLIGSGLGLHDDLSALLRGEAIARPISEDIVLRDVRRDPEALWSFLLFSGYLTADDPLSRGSDGLPNSPLRIPNHEIAAIYRTIFSSWLRRTLGQGSDAPRRLAEALLEGDASRFEALLERLMVQSLSFHDVGGRQPEAVYQAFIVGLLVQLEPTHELRSNRESGHGRYDILVRPRVAGSPGAVLELKVLDQRRGETPEQALNAAMSQIRDRAYAAELLAAGASPAWQVAAVFDGKRAWVTAERAG